MSDKPYLSPSFIVRKTVPSAHLPFFAAHLARFGMVMVLVDMIVLCCYGKIFGAIVRSIPVDVMDYFVGIKESAKPSLHRKPMLCNSIGVLVSPWMSRGLHVNIPPLGVHLSIYIARVRLWMRAKVISPAWPTSRSLFSGYVSNMLSAVDAVSDMCHSGIVSTANRECKIWL